MIILEYTKHNQNLATTARTTLITAIKYNAKNSCCARVPVTGFETSWAGDVSTHIVFKIFCLKHHTNSIDRSLCKQLNLKGF